MIVYRIRRTSQGTVEAYRETDNSFGKLNPRHDLVNHSPDGFEYGYAGSRPAQLALAILADAVGDEVALKNYTLFKHDMIARRPRYEDWSITQQEVQKWIEKHRSGIRKIKAFITGAKNG